MTSLLQDWVTLRANEQPNRTAVVSRDARLTYAQLETAATQMARALIAEGCQPGDRVCLLLPKDLEAIVAILGILKAGCAYVPLDLASPAPRVQKMIAACEPRVLLTEPRASEHVSGSAAKVCVVQPGSAVEATRDGCFWRNDGSISSELPSERRTGSDAAYILFTSGSTGAPKGVVITHDNVIHFVRWAVDYFELRPEDRLSGHPPLHFDLSVFDMFGAFAAGAELHLVGSELNLVPAKLAALIRDRALTQWFSVPSVLTYLAKFDLVREGDFPSLRRVLWCGEVLPTPTLRYWMDRLPHVQFTNLYGPTETTIASSYHTVASIPGDDKQEIPIGRPCAGECLYVLNDRLEEVEPNELGDLYIGGVGLSPGYWRDPDKTNAVFVTGPAGRNERLYKTGDLARRDHDGLFYFAGRADDQIKSRGYRIELGEIESALHTLETIREGAVVAVGSGDFDGVRICCAYVPKPGGTSAPSALRSELAAQLPSYMLPSRWMEVTALPRNANGKVDKPRIREMFVAEEAED